MFKEIKLEYHSNTTAFFEIYEVLAMIEYIYKVTEYSLVASTVM